MFLDNGPIVDIIRHGQSTSNAGEAAEKFDTIPLTELGEKQSEALSKSFNKHTPPGLIIVSPYTRAKQTAAPTIKRFPHVPVEVWPIHEFVQLDPIRWANTNGKQRGPTVKEYWSRSDPNERDSVRSETFNGLVERIDFAIHKFSALANNRYTVAFCHGLFMQVLFLRLTQPDVSTKAIMTQISTFRVQHPLGNTERLRLKIVGGALMPIKNATTRPWMDVHECLMHN